MRIHRKTVGCNIPIFFLKKFHFFKSFFELSLSHLIERGENRMKSIIKWFVILIHKDMKNYVMDEQTDQLIQKELKDKNLIKQDIISDTKKQHDR